MSRRRRAVGNTVLQRRQRGMVTVELAIGLLAVLVLLVTLVSIVSLGVTRSAAVTGSAIIAREIARGDQAAARAAQTDLPPHSTVTVRKTAAGVDVTVVVKAQIVGVGDFPMTVNAWAAWEPGETP